MVSLTVQFKSITDVKNFVFIINRYPYEVDLSSGRYVVDAKSIMGIFSLELQKPILLKIHTEDCEELIQELEPFLST